MIRWRKERSVCPDPPTGPPRVPAPPPPPGPITVIHHHHYIGFGTREEYLAAARAVMNTAGDEI